MSLRSLLAFVMVASFVLGAAPATLADNRLNEGFTYEDPNFNCTYNRADLEHNSTQNRGISRVISKRLLDSTMTGRVPCGDFYPRPGGYLTAKFQQLKWNGSQWALCTSTNYFYNSTNASTFILNGTYQQNGSPPCGAGSYSILATGYVSVNGQWYGGSVQTLPGHNFP